MLNALSAASMSTAAWTARLPLTASCRIAQQCADTSSTVMSSEFVADSRASAPTSGRVAGNSDEGTQHVGCRTATNAAPSPLDGSNGKREAATLPHSPSRDNWRRPSLLRSLAATINLNGERGGPKDSSGPNWVRQVGRSVPNLHELLRNHLRPGDPENLLPTNKNPQTGKDGHPTAAAVGQCYVSTRDPSDRRPSGSWPPCPQRNAIG